MARELLKTAPSMVFLCRLWRTEFDRLRQKLSKRVEGAAQMHHCDLDELHLFSGTTKLVVKSPGTEQSHKRLQHNQNASRNHSWIAKIKPSLSNYELNPDGLIDSISRITKGLLKRSLKLALLQYEDDNWLRNEKCLVLSGEAIVCECGRSDCRFRRARTYPAPEIINSARWLPSTKWEIPAEAGDTSSASSEEWPLSAVAIGTWLHGYSVILSIVSKLLNFGFTRKRNVNTEALIRQTGKRPRRKYENNRDVEEIRRKTESRPTKYLVCTLRVKNDRQEKIISMTNSRTSGNFQGSFIAFQGLSKGKMRNLKIQWPKDVLKLLRLSLFGWSKRWKLVNLNTTRSKNAEGNAITLIELWDWERLDDAHSQALSQVYFRTFKTINGQNITNLRFADDTVLLASSHEDLLRMVQQLCKREYRDSSNPLKRPCYNQIIYVLHRLKERMEIKLIEEILNHVGNDFASLQLQCSSGQFLITYQPQEEKCFEEFTNLELKRLRLKMADSTPYASNPVNECNEKKREDVSNTLEAHTVQLETNVFALDAVEFRALHSESTLPGVLVDQLVPHVVLWTLLENTTKAKKRSSSFLARQFFNIIQPGEFTWGCYTATTNKSHFTPELTQTHSCNA
ncbi:hypothetical protein GQR58_008050 [Nymphon striatum]|nr:hypothetical protein GQR58_008050 [Nymphon striatum]